MKLVKLFLSAIIIYFVSNFINGFGVEKSNLKDNVFVVDLTNAIGNKISSPTVMETPSPTGIETPIPTAIETPYPQVRYIGKEKQILQDNQWIKYEERRR